MRPLGTSDPNSVSSYRLVGVLGGGGMGRVYLGQSPSGRYVAIKVIRPELAADPVFRRRFSREVAAARLVNPLFTAAVVDADTEAESPWLATTYIEGPSLEQRVSSSGPLPVGAVLTLATGLAEALMSIHRVGLTHRDLKPANILLDDAGPHIIDFGIALASDAERMTTSVNVGTPSYMAPERIQGEEGGPPGDIFSLGATLYLAATGRTLITGGSMFEQINQVTQGRFDLSVVPADVRPFIVRCISLRPHDRPTARELSRILIGTGVATPTPGWYQPLIARPVGEPAPPDLAPAPTWGTPKLWQRRPVLTGGALGVLGLALGGAWALTHDGGDPDADASPALRSSTDGTGAARSPAGPVTSGTVLWQVASRTRPERNRLVVADAGRLVGTDGPRVFATDQPAGAQAWSVPLGQDRLDVHDWGPAVLVTAGSKLWRVDIASGLKVFDTDAGGFVGEVALTAERAYLGVDDELVAINRMGTPVWRDKADESPLAADSRWLLTRREEGDQVRVTLRDAATGRSRWNVLYRPAPPSDQRGGPGGPPGGGGPGGPPDESWEMFEARIGADRVLLRDANDLRMLRLSDGKLLWRKTWEKPVAAVELVGSIVVMAADRIVGFRSDNGTKVWQTDLRGARLAVAPDGKLIYAVAEERFAALDHTGQAVWHAPLPPTTREGSVQRLVVRPPVAYLILRPPPFQDSNEPDVVAVALAPGAGR